MSEEFARIRVSCRRITVVLAVTSALFTVLGIATQWMSVGPGIMGMVMGERTAHLFDLDAEAALPAYFQTGMLMMGALLLWVIGATRREGEPYRRHWNILAAVFLYLSADENATIHETAGFWISEHFKLSFGVYAWLIPAAILLTIMAIYYFPFIMRLPQETRVGVFVAGCVYVGGAAGVELIEAPLDRLWGSLPFSMLVVVEETLEMAGLVIFIHALLSYLRTEGRDARIIVDP
jgi:hypothetical protein